MSNVITLPAQPTFTTPRSIAGMDFMLTLINGQLHLSAQQAMQLVGLSDGKTFRLHVDAVVSQDKSGGGMASPPQMYETVHEIPVTFEKDKTGWGGGGTQLLKFYHPRLVFNIGLRTRNSENKSAVMNWLIDIGNEVVQQGFVLDQTALTHDPNVKVRMEHSLYAHNFTALRHNVADQNVTLLKLIARCHDVWDENGRLSNAKVSYCQVRIHNTAHVSVHGMTAGQLVYARINGTHPFLGQVTFAGQFCPIQIDYRNACNYLTPHELEARLGVIHAALNRIHMYIDQHGAISYSQMLRMFVMYCKSEHIPGHTWNWADFAETAIYTVVNMPDTANLKKHVYEAIQVWKALYPDRKTLDHFQMGQLMQAEGVLTDVCLSGEDILN